MRCTNLNRCAHMVVAFCRWPYSNIGIRGGTVITVRRTPTVLC
jgi:hypothetical protein